MASEMAEDFRILKEEKKKRHNEWYEKNSKIIKSYFIPKEYVEHDTVFLIRIDDFEADFYPHTGRWKYKNKMYRGGADKFIAFANKNLWNWVDK